MLCVHHPIYCEEAKVTRIEGFLQRNGIKPIHLARKAGISRQHLRRIRTGVADPTRPIIKDLTIAVRRLLQRPVRASELFELGDD
jgi:predicted transcriptional regulator